MKYSKARLLLLIFLVLFCRGMVAQVPATGTKSALLIGIDSYSHSATDVTVPDGAPRTGRYEPLLIFHDLKGPSHDVAAMRALLTSEKFGFPNDDKHIHTLLNQAATRDAVLKAMQQYLVNDPKPGDTVVLFVSSHGSLRADPKGTGQKYDLDGTGKNPSPVQNTIVPYDWYLGQDDIFSRDLRHIFNQAADRGIHLTAIFDSCHSGSLARGAESTAYVARDFDFDPRPIPDDPYPKEAAATPPETRADNPVLVLSAAQKDQSAIDVQNSDPPHGLFTDALIETLEALPANRPASEVFRRLQVAMEMAPGAANQQPELDTAATRKEEPLFGGKAGTGPATAAVVSVDGKSAVLDIGTIADIGTGSEFTEVNETNGARAVLEVTDAVGLARSKATVISPAGARVQAKDIVQLTKWVPAQRPTLNFYAGASNPSLADIQDALALLRTTNIKFAADPSTDTWTHRMAWDGAHWVLYAHSKKTGAGEVQKENSVLLGAKLSSGSLKKLPAGSILWFDAPLPKESVRGLLAPVAGMPPNAAQLTTDRSQAMYVIAGAPGDAGIEYTWYKRDDMDAEVQWTKDGGAGCSPHSPYPLRTDWAVQSNSVPIESTLSDAAIQLARLNGWLHLDSSALGGQSAFPYRLALRQVPEKPELQNIVDGGNTVEKGNYELLLVGKANAAVTPRWVYVLGIDCQGKGSLLWPYDTPPEKFPSDKGRLSDITLPGDPFPVGDPLGTDTYVLLTTSSPLADPSALEFKGVVTRGAKAAAPDNPLEDLLDNTSAGTRGATRPTPTNWSIQSIKTQSLSEAAANGKAQ